MKKYEVRIEVIMDCEVTVYAESFEDAVKRGETMLRDDVIHEGVVNDTEQRVIGVFRSKEARMYR